MRLDFLTHHDFMNRELSWLAFNERVLALSQDAGQPLLERANFLSITQSNFDEWYMVRMADLIRDIQSGNDKKDPAGMTPQQQMNAVRHAIRKQLRHQYQSYEVFKVALSNVHLPILPVADLKAHDRTAVRQIFQQTIQPQLTLKAMDETSLSKVSNGTINFVVGHTGDADWTTFALPTTTPRFIRVPGPNIRFVTTTDVVTTYIADLATNLADKQVYQFRILQDMSMPILPKSTTDVVDAIQAEVDKRATAPAINLTVSAQMPAKLKRHLQRVLGVDRLHVFKVKGPLAYDFVTELNDLLKQEGQAAEFAFLHYHPYQPHQVKALAGADIFDNIVAQDYLVHHPYDSYDAVLNFFQQAAHDDSVSEIGISIYRVSHDSPIVAALTQAAQAGKHVMALVEIKARFDEPNNLKLVDTLQAAGVTVFTSFPAMKVHAKMAYVVWDCRTIVHLGTGNYNDKTAHFYTDFGLFTADEYMTADVRRVFAYVTGQSSQPQELADIRIAPNMLRATLVEQIDEMIVAADAGKHPEIWFKVNSISDQELIERLYIASQAGVHIHLLVRGIATAMPNLPNVSENIQIRSIVGRLLEHSRIYLFKRDKEDVTVYLASADAMPRNFDRRVELLFPIHDATLKHRIRKIFRQMWSDRAQSFNKTRNGRYVRRKLKADSDPVPVQERLLIAAENEND